MKFEELENSLKKEIESCYIINGGEGILTQKALEKIEKALNISLPDFNKTIIEDSSNKTAKDIVSMCQIAPFCDAKRLIIVADIWGKKNESEKKVIEKYLLNPSPFCCLIFFSSQKSDFFASIAGNIINIDCEKVSNEYIYNFVVNEKNKNGFTFENGAIEKLLDYCNFSITKVDSELKKLFSAKTFERQISNNDIDTLVTKNIEYVIFDLTNAISQKNNDKVLLLVDTMLKNKEQPINIIATISNHFRRLFLVARSDFSTQEMASMLGIKEFAVTKYKQQALNFSQKRLKEIYDKCIQVEYMAKNGEMEGKNAIQYLVISILN